MPSDRLLACFVGAHPGISGVFLLDTDSLAGCPFHGRCSVAMGWGFSGECVFVRGVQILSFRCLSIQNDRTTAFAVSKFCCSRQVD